MGSINTCKGGSMIDLEARRRGDAEMERLKQMLTDAMTSINSTAENTVNAINASSQVTYKLERALSQASDVTKAIDATVIKDKNLVDALNMYTLMLSRTKDILGDERMTDEVSVKAIEAASFGAWRAIMGPKDKGGSKGGMWS